MSFVFALKVYGVCRIKSYAQNPSEPRAHLVSTGCSQVACWLVTKVSVVYTGGTQRGGAAVVKNMHLPYGVLAKPWPVRVTVILVSK